MRNLAILLALIAGLFVPEARADFTAKDASAATVTFKNPATCTSVVCVPVVQLYDGTNVVTLTTAGADGASNTLTGVPTYGRMQVYNGTTWDRWQGAIKAASGAFASGSIASGAFASGSIGSGAMVDLGAIADAAATAGSTGTLSAKVRLMTTQLATINTTLGSPFQAGGSIGNTAFGISGTVPNPTTAAAWGLIAAGSTTSGTLAQLGACAITTSSPSYTTAQNNFFSCDTSGNLRVSVVAGGGAYSAGSFAAGAFAAGALATGAGVDGWDLTQGAKADGACSTATGTCSVVALLKFLNTAAGSSTPAGTNVIGKTGIDQTTDGTTNLAAIGAQAGASGATTRLIQCDSTAVYDASTSGSTQLVALTSGKTIYVCGYSIMGGGTVNVKLIYGTGTACATGSANMTPAYQLTAQAGIVDKSPFYSGLKTAASSALCINASGAVAAQAIVYYAQF